MTKNIDRRVSQHSPEALLKREYCLSLSEAFADAATQSYMATLEDQFHIRPGGIVILHEKEHQWFLVPFLVLKSPSGEMTRVLNLESLDVLEIPNTTKCRPVVQARMEIVRTVEYPPEGRIPDGTAGLRDVDAPCIDFHEGVPSGRCESDGHYLCHRCVNYREDADAKLEKSL